MANPLDRTDPLLKLPPGLPAPVDDGACRDLRGASLPRLSLPTHSGHEVSLRDQSIRQLCVVVVHPGAEEPGKAPPAELDGIPGARGCMIQASSFRDVHEAFLALPARVFGLSAQPAPKQREMADYLRLPYELLSDEELRLQSALHLPTFEWRRHHLLRRVTLVLRNGRVRQVFYPVFPPEESAQQVLEWLRANINRP